MLEGKEWRKAKGASAAAVDRLKAIAPAPLPDSYFELLSFSNGGAGPLPVQPLWLSLYSAEDVIETERAGTYQELFPKLFVIGSNGGGEAIAFDLRVNAPYPLVAFDMTNINLTESVIQIAASFDDALGMIGVN